MLQQQLTRVRVLSHGVAWRGQRSKPTHTPERRDPTTRRDAHGSGAIGRANAYRQGASSSGLLGSRQQDLGSWGGQLERLTRLVAACACAGAFPGAAPGAAFARPPGAKAQWHVQMHSTAP